MRATIVIEHIIQAADVSHCMQHWQVYKRWNERLFQEMYLAYEEGRGPKDPSEGWYKGELWFFDNYIIPLAKKLEECGVFGVSSDECLNYALQNRKEWASKGQEVVEEMVERFKTWRRLGLPLGNPLQEEEEEEFDSGRMYQKRDVEQGLPAPPLVSSDEGNFDDDEEEDDESIVVA